MDRSWMSGDVHRTATHTSSGMSMTCQKKSKLTNGVVTINEHFCEIQRPPVTVLHLDSSLVVCPFRAREVVDSTPGRLILKHNVLIKYPNKTSIVIKQEEDVESTVFLRHLITSYAYSSDLKTLMKENAIHKKFWKDTRLLLNIVGRFFFLFFFFAPIFNNILT